MSNDPFGPRRPPAEPPIVFEPSGAPVTPEERAERLSRIISSKTLQGYVVIDRSDRDATAVLSRPGKEVNHVLHVLITIFTCGLWVIPWLVMGVTKRKEERLRVTIDAYGNLIEERVTVQ